MTPACCEVLSALGPPRAWPLHGLELADDVLLGVALLYLLQRLILVPALPHVLIVNDVTLILIRGLGQLVTQSQLLRPHNLIRFCLRDPLLLLAVIQDDITGELNAIV